MRRVPTVVLLALLLVLVPVLGGAAASPGGADGRTASLSGPRSLTETQQQFDRTEFHVTVYENGSARWTFQYKQTLSNETERQDFETYAAEFNRNDTELYTGFQSRSRALTERGANATGREMAATDFTKEAFVNDFGNQGVVEMSFRWEGFAPTDGERVTVGDVFEGGLYIRADQRLVFSHGPNLAFEEVSPSPDSFSGDSVATSDSVTWTGERSFTDERPRLVLSPADGGTSDGGAGTETGGGGETTPGAGGGNGGGGLGLLPIVALVVVLVVGVVAAFAYRSGALGGAGTETPGDDDGGDADAGGAVTAPAAGEEGPSAPPAVTEEELLSDEDRVMKLLDENGGRMKQVNIVDETGWSKSKVSMLLSDMEEADQISKLRVGRENIISKKGMEPEAARSPFEDEDD